MTEKLMPIIPGCLALSIHPKTGVTPVKVIEEETDPEEVIWCQSLGAKSKLWVIELLEEGYVLDDEEITLEPAGYECSEEERYLLRIDGHYHDEQDDEQLLDEMSHYFKTLDEYQKLS